MGDANNIVSGVWMGIGIAAGVIMILVYAFFFKKYKMYRWAALKGKMLSHGGYRVPMLEAVVGPENYKEYVEELIETEGEPALLRKNRREDRNFNIHKMHAHLASDTSVAEAFDPN
jgi:hypothetical protein